MTYVSEEAELNAFTAEQQIEDDSWVRLAGLEAEQQARWICG